jgi:PAS domain S-box-containing protein
LAFGFTLRKAGSGPGIVAGVLGLIGLNAFVHPPTGWFRIEFYNVPFFCLVLGTGWSVFRFHTSIERETQERTAKLTEINERYRGFLEAAPWGIARLGEGRVVLQCNSAYEKMLGYGPGELLGKPAPLPDIERERWLEVERKLRKGKTVVNYEAQRMRKDGSIFSATISMTPLFDQQGGFTELVGLIIDDTERHERDAERRMLTALAQHSPSFFGVADLNGGARFINSAGQAMFGLDGDDQVQETNILDFFTEEDRPFAAEHLIPELKRNGQLDFETRGRNFRTGKEFPLYCSWFVIPDRSGQPAFLASIAQDISERKRAETKLRMYCSIVRNSPDPVSVADMNLHPIYLNRAGKEQLGIATDEQLSRTHILDFFADDQRDHARNESIPALLKQGHLTEEIHARNLETGETFPAQWTSFLIYDEKTKVPMYMAAVIKDITERKRTENDLRRHDLYLSEGEKISHTGSWMWNPVTKACFCSQELLRILGLDGNAAASTPETYFERIHADDRQECERVWTRAIQEKANFNHEHRIQRPDGSIRYVLGLGRHFEDSCGRSEFIGTVVDVTEQHNDKAELQRLLDQTKALEDKLNQQVISLQEQNVSLKHIRPGEGFRRIIGSSPAIELTLDQIEMVAPTDSTVLITGETGTGKELVARAIHLASLRADKPFVAFNSATLSTDLAMSELFGHEKGSFTGADARHIGQIELADEGTIFLDEVGDMPREAQAKLLRFLQEREFFRVGGNRPIQSDVRVLAATNRDLQVAVEKGEFRNDLFFRLKDFPIQVPPLRDRQEDIDPLVWHFVRLYGKKLGKNIRKIEQRSMEQLHIYPWPGNVRELENVIRTAVIRTAGEVLVITESQLPRRTETLQPAQLPFLDMPLAEGVEEYEIARIKDALMKCGGVVEGPDGAAKLLKKRPGSLRYKIRTLGIDANRYRGHHGGEK